MSIENKRLRVELCTDSLVWKLEDKTAGTEWNAPELFHCIYGDADSRPMPLTHRHCTVNATERSDAIELKLHSFRYWARWPENPYCRPENGPDISFSLRLQLLPDHLALEISEIQGLDDEEFSIAFPSALTRFPSNREFAIVFPVSSGQLFRFPCQDRFLAEWWLERGQIPLPIFGIGNNHSGLAAIVSTPFDCKIKLDINKATETETCILPRFVFEKQHANYRRRLEIHPLENTSTLTLHVALAKLYRRRLMEQGRFVPLTEKISRHPNVEKLVGAVIWKHNVFSASRPESTKHGHSLYVTNPKFAEYEGTPGNWTAEEIFSTAKKRGFDRVAVFNTGWNYGGFDSHYPTRLPPNPERGAEEDFRSAADHARALGTDYIYSVHDNYYDVYQNSPEWDEKYLKKDRHGVPMRGGIWQGGRAYLICPQAALEYARRDIPRIREMLGKGGIYLDCFGGTLLTGCWTKRLRRRLIERFACGGDRRM